MLNYRFNFIYIFVNHEVIPSVQTGNQGYYVEALRPVRIVEQRKTTKKCGLQERGTSITIHQLTQRCRFKSS
jgi:hypothetical protein